MIVPSPDELANEIRIRRTSYTGPFLFVEGYSDITFFSCRMNFETENIIPTFGWENLSRAMTILQSDGIQNVLGIVDLDYRNILDYPTLPPDTILTDSHDLEMMMLSSPVFAKVLRYKSSVEKLKTYPGGVEGVKNKISEIGKPIGSLRFYSQLKSDNYSFKNMNFDKFVDKKSLIFLPEMFIAHIRGIHDNNRSIVSEELNQAIKETEK